jgi:UDP-glucose:(heptosyl)LPS alpha-1,3-glucosyltransferase
MSANDRRPLHVAFVRQRYSVSGGAERFLARAMRALAERGISTTLVTRRWPKDAAGDHVVCDPPYLGSLMRDWTFARCACRALAMQRFDLVQSHERIACCDVYRAGDGVHAEWLAQRSRAQSGMQRWLTRMNPYHLRTLAAERRMFEGERLRAVICNSRMVRDEIEEHFDIAPEKLHVIRSGVDTRHFNPEVRALRDDLRVSYGVPGDAPMFLFVGGGWERKGLATAIRALTAVPHGFLMIVGRDKRRAHFTHLANQLGVEGRLRFAGVHGDVRPFYGAADALMLPTLYDPFPNVALEAMACGLVVLSSTKSGSAEIIEEGKSGFVRDALDVDGFADALRLLAEPERARTMGDAARIAVEPRTLDAMSGELVAFYESLLAE